VDSIKFVNGSEIKILEGTKPSNAPMLIFGVDMAKEDSDDYSCISYFCSSCKTIVSTNYFKNGVDNNEPILPANCPNCGVTFKGYIQSS